MAPFLGLEGAREEALRYGRPRIRPETLHEQPTGWTQHRRGMAMAREPCWLELTETGGTAGANTLGRVQHHAGAAPEQGWLQLGCPPEPSEMLPKAGAH